MSKTAAAFLLTVLIWITLSLLGLLEGYLQEI